MPAIDKDAIHAAYEEVRDDNNETSWFTVVYSEDGKSLEMGEKGTNYEDLVEHFADDARLYTYVRITTGDEMSKRAKFVFISWIGPSVSALKKAKVSTDKSFVKQIVTSFAVEILADEKGDITYEKIVADVIKAGGANYGTGQRD